jgi:hypothetical protein
VNTSKTTIAVYLCSHHPGSNPSSTKNSTEGHDEDGSMQAPETRYFFIAKANNEGRMDM